jgi:hypothetical protein
VAAEPVPRDLPGRSGVSKEAITAVGFLQRSGMLPSTSLAAPS